MNRTDIEYLDFTWNPVVGCANGCPWCWARRQAKRQKHNCRKCYAFKPHLHPERLDEPLKKRKPSVIGSVFMGDLFDPRIITYRRYSPVLEVIEAMEAAPWHTFVVLTKQPQRAKLFSFPPNVVLGVSVEDQESADRLVPELMECPAATRIVSVEPMRGPVDLRPSWIRPQRGCDGHHSHAEKHPNGSPGQPAHHHHDEFCGPRLDGIILGGQTGAGAVPMHPDWVRAVRDQCQAAGVPFFFKQWGEWKPGPLRACKQGLDDCWRAANDYHVFPNGEGANRVGRKAAGRVLDGRERNGVAWNTKGGKA